MRTIALPSLLKYSNNYSAGSEGKLNRFKVASKKFSLYFIFSAVIIFVVLLIRYYFCALPLYW